MRRRTLLLGAAGTGLAATGGAAAFALTREPSAALRPWDEAGRDADPRRFVIGHAILAPNPHNRQPWVFELVGGDAIRLRCDLDRRLPETDPFDRQVTIGLGCAIELASLAAGRLGRALDVAAFPEGEPGPRLDGRPVALLRLVARPGLAPDPLVAAIPHRRSTKRPYDLARTPSPEALAAVVAAAAGEGAAVAAVSEPGFVARLRDLTWRAWEVEATTPRTFAESVRLMRIGRAEIEARPDGISLRGPMLEALAAFGSLTRERLADPASSAFAQGRETYRAMLAGTPAYLTVVAPAGRRGELAAGRAYVRANLAATAAGLAMHPVSQALQEFPEMAELKGAVERELGVAAPARLHMLARIGYGPAVPRSPRWAAGTRMAA